MRTLEAQSWSLEFLSAFNGHVEASPTEVSEDEVLLQHVTDAYDFALRSASDTIALPLEILPAEDALESSAVVGVPAEFPVAWVGVVIPAARVVLCKLQHEEHTQTAKEYLDSEGSAAGMNKFYLNWARVVGLWHLLVLKTGEAAAAAAAVASPPGGRAAAAAALAALATLQDKLGSELAAVHVMKSCVEVVSMRIFAMDQGRPTTVELLESRDIAKLRSDPAAQADLLKTTSDARSKQLMKQWRKYLVFHGLPEQVLATLPLTDFEEGPCHVTVTMDGPTEEALQRVRVTVAALAVVQGALRKPDGPAAAAAAAAAAQLAQAKARAAAIINLADLPEKVAALLN